MKHPSPPKKKQTSKTLVINSFVKVPSGFQRPCHLPDEVREWVLRRRPWWPTPPLPSPPPQALQGKHAQLCFFSRVHLNVSQEEVNSCRSGSALRLGPAYSWCPSSFLACVVSLPPRRPSNGSQPHPGPTLMLTHWGQRQFLNVTQCSWVHHPVHSVYSSRHPHERCLLLFATFGRYHACLSSLVMLTLGTVFWVSPTEALPKSCILSTHLYPVISGWSLGPSPCLSQSAASRCKEA